MRLALYQPDIPQNLGAFIRLAACLGAPLDIIEPCGFPVDDRRIRRAAMDYVDLAQIRRHASWDAFRRDRAPGRLVLLTTAGASRLPDVAFRADDILLLGRESAGVPAEVHDAAELRVRIPHADRLALAQCRAGRGDGIERGAAPDRRIPSPRMTDRRSTPRADTPRLVRGAARPHLRRVRGDRGPSSPARTATCRPAASSASPGSASAARRARIAAAA